MTNSLPEKLGKYKIVEEVGRGGFAAVYKAVDTTLNRTVALKVLAPHLTWDFTFVQRFQREAEVSANLDHPNIVTIYEVSQVEGAYCIAMQFLEGRTLSQILEAEGPLPVSRAQVIVEQIASALDYAHARGFVHRDVKPSNVIVADDGRVTVTDFGLVKAGEGTKLTATGEVVGTPEYMSPEQAEGLEEPDARSDIYSLGVMAYQMLTGKVPFSGAPVAVMRCHADKPPPRPSEVNPAVPMWVEAVLLKALAKKREERYQSAGEMARAWAAAVETRAEPKVEKKKPAVAKEPEPVHPAVLERVQPFEPEMVLIPAGEFLMGSDPKVDKNAQDDEQPQHTLYLPDYYLARTPVTNAQYAAFAQSTGHKQPKHWKGGKPPSGKEDHPVVNVSWHDAVAYCNWLAEVTGKSYRLPSEAEWEKGARGSDGRISPWGNRWDAKRCNIGWHTTPAGAYPEGASPYGLLDMIGNVWEWTRSVYKDYPYDPNDGREDLKAEGSRVLRGGSWFNVVEGFASCSSRCGVRPSSFADNNGFRLLVSARSLP